MWERISSQAARDLPQEVQEESGVMVDRKSIKYVASQPWLFPRSLMVGFLAEAKETSITVDEEEMEAVECLVATICVIGVNLFEPHNARTTPTKPW